MPIARLTPENGLDPERVQGLVDDLVTAFQKHKPTLREILLAYGNLGYILGASIEGYKEKGPSEIELTQIYKTQPKVGVALMLQAISTCAWVEDLQNAEEMMIRLTDDGGEPGDVTTTT